MKSPLPLAALLEAALAGKPAARRLREAKIWLVWDETVGEQIAAKAQPASFREGTLTVTVAGSVWLQQLSLMKQAIVSRLNDAIGSPLVTELFFKQGALRARPVPRAAVPDAAAGADAGRTAEIAALTAAVDDPELRAALSDLLALQRSAAPRRSNP